MLVLPIFMTIENDEERALAENLYLTYKSRMYGIAYAILHNREDAEDAVMDAVFGIVKNISLFSSIPRNKTESLIVVISRNAAINRYNYNKRRSTSSLDETANYIPDNNPTPEEMFGQKLTIGSRRLNTSNMDLNFQGENANIPVCQFDVEFWDVIPRTDSSKLMEELKLSQEVKQGDYQ